MYINIIKQKKIFKYISTSILAFIFLIINIFVSLENFDKSEIEKLEFLLKKQKLSNVELKVTLDDLINKNLEIFRKSINSNDLQNDLTTLCNSLIKYEVLKECKVANILSPYEYTNVAKFTLLTFNEVDKLILKRLIEEIYNIKKINDSNIGVDFEVFNKN